MTAPKVRADTRGNTVDIAVPSDAYAEALIHIAVEHRRDSTLADALDELATAYELTNADPGRLAAAETTRDAAFDRLDEALRDLAEQLPTVTCRIPRDDVPALIDGLYKATAPPGLLTPEQAANVLDVGVRTVARWADQGCLDSVRTRGGHRRYPEDAVQRKAAARASRVAS